jgi:hypothetical protein
MACFWAESTTQIKQGDKNIISKVQKGPSLSLLKSCLKYFLMHWVIENTQYNLNINPAF